MKTNGARLLWNLVWLFLFRPTPSRGFRLFNAWRIFLLRVFGAKIGSRCLILSSSKVLFPWNLTLGDDSALDEGVTVETEERVVIGDSVWVSQGALLCGASLAVDPSGEELARKPIRLCSESWVCARAIILPGVTVGEGAVVAAGAVVTKDVPPRTVVAGNPAREVKKRVLKS